MMHMSDYRDRPWRKANEPRYGTFLPHNVSWLSPSVVISTAAIYISRTDNAILANITVDLKRHANLL